MKISDGDVLEQLVPEKVFKYVLDRGWKVFAEDVISGVTLIQPTRTTMILYHDDHPNEGLLYFSVITEDYRNNIQNLLKDLSKLEKRLMRDIARDILDIVV